MCSICGTKHLPSCRTALCRCACACTACSISACRRRKRCSAICAPAERETTDETDTRAALFDMMTEMEPYDETWPDYVQLLEDNGLQANLDDIDGGYENLLVYFLYRHFAHGVTDGRIAARVGFCAVSVWFICPDEHKVPA